MADDGNPPSLHDACKAGTASDVREVLHKLRATQEETGWDINTVNKVRGDR